MNMNRAHLTPTTITDKNGKQTTVYKKQQSATARQKQLPSPALPLNNDLTKKRMAVAERIIGLSGRLNDRTLHSYVFTEVQDYSASTVANIERALQNDDQLARSVAEDLVNGEEGKFVSEALHFYWKTGSTDYQGIALDVRTLTHYPPFIVHRELIDTDENTQKQCLAFLRFPHLIDTPPNYPSPFINYINYDDRQMKYIKDQTLVNLIANRPDDIERIAEIILQHRTSDGATINGILEGTLPSLAEGQL